MFNGSVSYKTMIKGLRNWYASLICTSGLPPRDEHFHACTSQAPEGANTASTRCEHIAEVFQLKRLTCVFSASPKIAPVHRKCFL